MSECLVRWPFRNLRDEAQAATVHLRRLELRVQRVNRSHPGGREAFVWEGWWIN